LISFPTKLSLRDADLRRLKTHMQNANRARPKSALTLASGQSAQLMTVMSDGPGRHESTRSACEPTAHSLRIHFHEAVVTAAMDPTPVCEHGVVQIVSQLRTLRLATPCSARTLRGTVERVSKAGGTQARYRIGLTVRRTPACRLRGIVGLQLLTNGGRPLPIRLHGGVNWPDTVVRMRTVYATFAVSIRGGFCDEATAHKIAIKPSPERSAVILRLRHPVIPCQGGNVRLSGLSPYTL
jgi:hypothetical protein